MDIITTNYFNKFLKEQGITGTNTDTNFEKFVNYICLSSKNISNFNLAAACVGAGNDAGIDGIAISINNRFVSDMTELETILDLGMDFSIEFFFIQAKTSEAFECKEISSFSDGVSDMFKSELEIKKVMNEVVTSKYKMIREILNNYEYAKQKKCILYYVTPGNYVEDDNLLATKIGIRNKILNLGIFEDTDIEINIEDRTFIRKQYEKTKVQNSATFELSSKIDIPYMDKVEEAYFAIMPIKEYLKIVLDENRRIRRGIFELNVRDFAGIEENRVNQDIVSTLHSDDSTKFGLLNNGITIVGKSLSKGQGKYTIKNFYIVNGCQTTNVLSENVDKIKDGMWLSVKIVITQDDKIIRDIVKATNNQTEVAEIQLLSMDEYQQELESFYNSYNKYTRLYYERRDGQYRGNPEAELIKIVSPEIQMKSFASIFLNSPHIASRFAGKLHEEISKKIFIKDHRSIMYYVAGLINYRLEKAFINDEINGVYNKFKYHIETIVSHVVWKNEKRPQLNSYKMDDYCEKLILAIEDDTHFMKLLEHAQKCIDSVIKNINDTDANKTVAVVNQLLLYSEIEWNKVEINQAIYFNNIIENYLIPFENMAIDGDMRYNFSKNFTYLSHFIDDNDIARKLISHEILIEASVDINEDNRDSRKLNSKKICNEIYRANKLINEKLKIANMYKDRI